MYIVRCEVCGFITTEIRIDPESVYSGEYFEGEAYPDYEEEKGALQANFRRRLEQLRRLQPDGVLFEIGCAYGFFLDLARVHYQASGIDISLEAVRHARNDFGVEAGSGNFLEFDDPERPTTDVICLWDVIEHLQRPDLFMDKASRWLKPGGLLALTTGDVASILARLQGAHWRMIAPPHHLHYFSPKTIELLLSRFDLDIVHRSYPAVWRTYANSIKLLFSSQVIESVLTVGSRLDFRFPINTFDTMFVIAQKRESEASS